jgi:probable rRNA maturation factor
VEITVNNIQQKVELPKGYEELVKKCIFTACKMEKMPDNCEVGVNLIDDEGIRLLNRDFRGLDEPTDVLSFSVIEPHGEEPNIIQPEDSQQPLVLGDIIISVETALKQAEEYGHSLEREIGFLVVHGILHLLGYDHGDETLETIMRKKQRVVLEKVGLTRWG